MLVHLRQTLTLLIQFRAQLIQPINQMERCIYVLCLFECNINGKEVVTYAFLDQGSTHTFCRPQLVDALEIKGAHENLCLQILNGTSKNHTSIKFCVSY